MEKNKSFEESFSRLEKILEKMNTGEASLDESLKLYEEADQLIRKCNEKLSSAEQKIETLIKERDGSLEKTESGEPATATFE